MPGKILLVDDDRDFAEGLAELLDLEGFTTNVAFNRADAISVNQANLPEISILDIRLGQEDGLSLIEALRADNPDVQCVMLTGYAALNTAVEAVRLGAQDYLMKPVERDQLRAVLDRCLRMRTLIDGEAGARATLAKSEEKYRLLTELSPVGVFQTDPGGDFTMVNQRWLALTGMNESDALGTGWQAALHKQDRSDVIENWEMSIRQIQPFNAEFRLAMSKDAVRWVLAQALPQMLNDGACAGYIGTITDITDHKELEQRQADARRAQALEAVAGGIAHHMNNALQIISGYLHLAREELPKPSQSREYLALSSDGILRLSTITRGLLHFTGATILNFEDVNLNDLITYIQTSITDDESAAGNFELKLADDLWKTKSEATQLRGALMAIIQNALDAMDGDGTVLVTGANRTLDEPPADLAPGDYVEITIDDNGPGMNEETAERALEPFFTTKGPQTTGLGLSMAQGIVRKTGGVMQLDSTPGQGTRITIYLPRSAP